MLEDIEKRIEQLEALIEDEEFFIDSNDKMNDIIAGIEEDLEDLRHVDEQTDWKIDILQERLNLLKDDEFDPDAEVGFMFPNDNVFDDDFDSGMFFND